jgi:hypothetical protein
MINRPIKLPFMDEVSVSIHREECSDCGVSGDFLNRNDPIITGAMRDVEKVFVLQTLDQFSEVWGVRFGAFERIFFLPFGTLDGWKAGTFTPEAIALLRLIRALPRLILLAEDGYSEKWQLRSTGNGPDDSTAT